jgi:hypothetical protein
LAVGLQTISLAYPHFRWLGIHLQYVFFGVCIDWFDQGGILAGDWEPGSQEIIKTHRKSLLELPVLALEEELLSGFPVTKKTVLVYKHNFL